jgi:hypothetical protein
MAYIYRHIRLDKNEPFYIGIGKDDLKEFKRAHHSGNKRNKIWKAITSKTGYIVEILFDDLSWEEAKLKEIEFIKLYGRINKGNGILSNMTDGGDGSLGCTPSPETIAKIIANTDYSHNRDPDKIKKIDYSYNRNPDKIKRSILNTDYKARNAKTDYSFNKNRDYTYLQKYCNTPEARQKQADSLKKPVLQYDLTGNLIKEWKGSTDAAINLGNKNSSSDIRKCCDNKIKTCKGYIWKWA